MNKQTPDAGSDNPAQKAADDHNHANHQHAKAAPGGQNAAPQSAQGQGAANKNSANKSSEDRIIDAGEQTVREMKDAMSTMMDASTQMMQSFLKMRMSYLRVMQAGFEDPRSSVRMMTKNMQDIADAVTNSERNK